MCAHLLLRELQNYNLLLDNCRQENVGSHQKKIPHIQGQRRIPSKMVGGAKSCLESNPIPARDSWRAQTNLVCTRTQEKGAVAPQETVPDLPVGVRESPADVWVSGGLLQGWGPLAVQWFGLSTFTARA